MPRNKMRTCPACDSTQVSVERDGEEWLIISCDVTEGGATARVVTNAAKIDLS